MKNEILNHIDKLGHKATDRVTGFKGVIDSVCFELYGCIQFTLRPEVDKEGKTPDARWFDVVRLEITSKKPVIDPPNFAKGYVAEGRKGPAEKPV